jgi:hypothetical protein
LIMAGLPFDYGVHIVEGVPGSGKSYVCVQWVIQAILEQRRPVYTNLPIRFRVLRRYLKAVAGPEVASLLQRLTPEIFERFAKRGHEYRTFRNDLISLARRRGETVPDEIIEQRWETEHGKNITDSEHPDCNWIPLGALVLYDEIQHHYPMKGQANEGSELLDYLTCHRHFCQQFIAVTQDKMNISNTIRKVCEYFWIVRNRRDDRLVFGLRFRHLRLLAFGYECWTKSALDAPHYSEAHAPCKQYTVYPLLSGSGRRIFKFYESFTAAGSIRRINEVIAQTRRRAGLTENGASPAEVQRYQERQMKLSKRQSSKIRRLLKRLASIVILITVVVSGVLIGRLSASIGQADQAGEVVQGKPESTEEREPEWPVLTGIGKGFVRFPSGRYTLGQSDPAGVRVSLIDHTRRIAIVRHGEHYAALQLRQPPRYLGTQDALERRLLALVQERTDSTP